MSEIKTQLPEGVPCWADLGVPDHRKAMDFYHAVLGWDFIEGTAETGFYTMCLVRGMPVAAVASPPGAETRASWWTHYFSTNSCDGIAKKIVDAGGILSLGPMDVAEAGRMAIAEDFSGATFGLWQGYQHIGTQIINEPGAMVWNELHTDDSDPARRFYLEVFEYDSESLPGMDYTLLRISDRATPIGGITATGELLGPAGRPHWLSYFGVTDTDAAAQAAVRRGGTIRHGPEDTPHGRFAILTDPFDAAFAVIETPEAPAG